MLYRALANLGKKDKTIQAGSLIDPSEFNPATIQRLMALGRIAPVASPPLSVLPGWKNRAKRLEALDITTVEQFLQCPDPKAVAEALGITIVRVQSLMSEARQRLLAPEPGA
jgi:hypothetical protein